MAVVSGQTKRFTAASPVTEYWLANCVGFSLSGGGRGVVERVLPDGDPHTASSFEVRRRGKVRRLPASAVVEVIPAEQVLVVRGSDRAPARRAAGGRGTAVLGEVAVAVGVLLLGIATWLVRAGKEAARLVRSLPWQQYGRSVRSVTTKLWQEISVTWWRLRTTSSAASSAKSSSKRARTTSST
jgi:hypothetical protein